MSFPGKLRVVGSREIYQLFLPPPGGPFRASEFTHVTKPNGDLKILQELDENCLTVVVNPDDFSAEAIASLPGPLWLWFLRRLSPPPGLFRDHAPRLYAEALNLVMDRRNILSPAVLDRTAEVIVSDIDSKRYCEAKGMSVTLSPPPVSDDVGVTTRWSDSAGLPLAQFSENLTKNGLLSLAASFPEWNFELREISEKGGIRSCKHLLVTQESLFPSFPYGVAAGLLAGLSVVSEPLTPRWGLEPGIDFFEVSTPEELLRIIEHIRRFGNLTQSLATRGNAKSKIFRSSAVFDKLLRNLKIQNNLGSLE